MKPLSVVYALITGVIVGFLGGFFDLPQYLVFLLVIVIIFFFFVFPIIRINWETDMKKTEKFLLKNKKNPLNQFFI